MKFRSILTRLMKFCTALVETASVVFLSLAVYLLITDKDEWTDLKILALVVVSGLAVGALATRILSIIDHGWRGLFTTYKSEK